MTCGGVCAAPAAHTCIRLSPQSSFISIAALHQAQLHNGATKCTWFLSFREVIVITFRSPVNSLSTKHIVWDIFLYSRPAEQLPNWSQSNVCGDDQLAAAQISLTDTALNKAHDVTMPLVKCALTSWGIERPLLL